jgi:hypothetical protein
LPIGKVADVSKESGTNIFRVKQETLKMEAMCSPSTVVMFTGRQFVASQQTENFNIMFELC